MLIRHKQSKPNPRHRLHCAARMNTLVAKAMAVRDELSACTEKAEARADLAGDLAEVQRFVVALGVFIDTVTKG